LLARLHQNLKKNGKPDPASVVDVARQPKNYQVTMSDSGRSIAIRSDDLSGGRVATGIDRCNS